MKFQSNKILFEYFLSRIKPGKIIQIRNKHNREMQEFEQSQLINKARMNQGLRDKLNVRRTRRTRIEMHKRQLEALQEYPPPVS